MKFISSTDPKLIYTFSQALLKGLADDGGLIVVDQLPKLEINQFSETQGYTYFSRQLLHEFMSGDPLDADLPLRCKNAFNYKFPLLKLSQNTFMLELFHGPTLSFKDFGARFLAQSFDAMALKNKITIFVATSGDTGSAVASAFHKLSNINVVILYPAGKVSNRQAHQITCWKDNVFSLAVDGNFDDCQRLMKAAFQDEWFQNNLHLSTSNSINLGRLLPQVCYYAFCSLSYFRHRHTKPGFVIPTGNLGNATAAYWAKAMGFPIREIVLATNANSVIPDYLNTGNFQARASIPTLANAMDVGNPSNLQRLQFLFPKFETFKENVRAMSVSDDIIKRTIVDVHRHQDIIMCPHTATAYHVRQQLSNEPWIIVATAHPAKFNNVIEPLLDIKLKVPVQLARLLAKKTHVEGLEPNLDALKAWAQNHISS